MRVLLLARPWPGRPVQRPCREETAVGVTAGFGWRGARLAGTFNSAGRQTIWRSQFVQGRCAQRTRGGPDQPGPTLPCITRSSAAGGSAGFKSSRVSHAKPPRSAGIDKPWPAAAARVMQQHAGQAS
ncbi:MAG: hypothetical protein ACYCY1_14465 [Sulfuriferula sp.]